MQHLPAVFSIAIRVSGCCKEFCPMGSESPAHRERCRTVEETLTGRISGVANAMDRVWDA